MTPAGRMWLAAGLLLVSVPIIMWMAWPLPYWRLQVLGIAVALLVQASKVAFALPNGGSDGT